MQDVGTAFYSVIPIRVAGQISLNESQPFISFNTTLSLRELESDGLITRTVFAEIPPRVEYALTELGTELLPICDQIRLWGIKHKESVAVVQ
ncbi:winged helix-turn-helix transcriptional regulator [Mucilaginibacter agri]|uniref:HTH hxlR-type domain-containing protein n=1 Tax=Mucilaginibacter agri TaxID=2695265 RepID=A0A965ZGA6_9SPHI|nr:helix-turn-helix domain-containing protein [Mucilaginibacter agri]NCD69141.1 hypothetical protein [Mucilaginibacter agri]